MPTDKLFITTSAADIFRALVDEQGPVGFRAWDGSAAGRQDVEVTVEARSPAALWYLLTAPSELGLARAYVTGAIDVHGDLHTALAGMERHRKRLARDEIVRLLRGLPWRELRSAPIPPEEAPPRWRRGLMAHTRSRDSVAIQHHYDLSNRFYRLVLGPSMAYSCAVFTSPDSTLDAAQEEKFDLICRKLDLRAGDRLLDVGAGWGGMVMHAAANYGVRAVGVTLSRNQVQWAQAAIAEHGLSDRAEVRLLDYRDLPDNERFDAVSSIGAMEHFGARELAPHFAAMARRLQPTGRMLNHCITRPSNRQRSHPGPFIDRYVFPDGELEGPGAVVAAMHDHGFEIRHEESLREHYAITLRHWGENLERRWDEAVAEVGERRARAWRLYMVISRLGFELGRVQIHQVLGVRPAANGSSGMPLRPDFMHPADRSELADSARNTPRQRSAA